MKIQEIDLQQKVFIIAEIGNNHEGNFEVAQKMLAEAASAGADAVKFQTFVPELFNSSTHSDPARLQRMKKFCLSFEQFDKLAQQAKDLGVIFFSTPLDLESARFLNTLQSLFKIASGDNNFFPLIETVAGFGKPMIVSTGLADLSLLETIQAKVKAIAMKHQKSPQLAFLHCVASYPVPENQANLAAIQTLQHHFPEVAIGYSDHTLGIQSATYAVAAGAKIIEKHFTLDKNYSDFRDHQLSADPAEMRQLVENIRLVTSLLGTGEKKIQPCEEAIESAVRRSAAAASDLPAGTILETSHLIWVRPASGLKIGQESQVLGHRLRRALKQGELILLEDVEA